MERWALVFFLFGGSYDTTPATGTVTGIESLELCEAAAAKIGSKDWYCVRTGPASPEAPRSTR